VAGLATQWFFLKHGLLKPGVKSYYRELLTNQDLDPEVLEQLSWKRTTQLLRHAYEHVPYYREKFKSLSLCPEDISEPKYFHQVPVLTRKDLQDHWKELISDEVTAWDLCASTTGGTTGHPVRVYHPRKSAMAAMGWRMLNWWGLSPDCNWASVYRDLASDTKGRLLRRIYWWPTRKVLLNATAFSDREIDGFIREFLRVRPPLVHGYVGALDRIAEHILDNGISLPPPRVVWTTSAPLTSIQERTIAKAFGSPVYDQYGCCEVYWLAAQCPAKRGLHMFWDARRIEFLDEDHAPQPVGSMGRIAVTDLLNKHFPLIRYLNGDRGRALPHSCDCGVTLPLMDKVQGRVSDTLRLPSGACVNGEYLTTLFDESPEAVKQFQVYQQKDHSIVIKAVPRERVSELPQLLHAVCDRLSRQVNYEVPVVGRVVDGIAQEGGKLKFVISDL